MIDDLDHKLIDVLRKDALLNGNELSKLLHVSPATAKRRLNRLIKENVIKIVAVVDPEKIGFPLIAGISMQANTENINTLAIRLSNHPNVN